VTTKTVRPIPTFLVLATLGVAAVVIVPVFKTGTQRDEPGQRTVIVTVGFTPATRTGKNPGNGGQLTDRVTASVQAGSKIIPKAFYTMSPKVWTLDVKAGNVVQVWAEQFYGDALWCEIRQPGHTPVQDQGVKSSEVHCTWSVV